MIPKKKSGKSARTGTRVRVSLKALDGVGPAARTDYPTVLTGGRKSVRIALADVSVSVSLSEGHIRLRVVYIRYEQLGKISRADRPIVHLKIDIMPISARPRSVSKRVPYSLQMRGEERTRGANHKISAVLVQEHLEVIRALARLVCKDELIRRSVGHSVTDAQGNSVEKRVIIRKVIAKKRIVALSLSGRHNISHGLCGSGHTAQLFLRIHLSEDLLTKAVVGSAGEDDISAVSALYNQRIAISENVAAIRQKLHTVLVEYAVIAHLAASNKLVAANSHFTALSHTVALLDVIIADEGDDAAKPKGYSARLISLNTRHENAVGVRGEGGACESRAIIEIFYRMNGVIDRKRALVLGSALVAEIKKELSHIIDARGAAAPSLYFLRHVVGISKRGIADLYTLGSESAENVSSKESVT